MTVTQNSPKQYTMVGVRLVAGVCADCGRECPERVFVVEDRETRERKELGSHCAWKATGVRNLSRVAPVDDTEDQICDGEIPDWMLGDG